jgi:hypothetical protein
MENTFHYPVFLKRKKFHENSIKNPQKNHKKQPRNLLLKKIPRKLKTHRKYENFKLKILAIKINPGEKVFYFPSKHSLKIPLNSIKYAKYQASPCYMFY